MKVLDFGRCALGICAVSAWLAGCGGGSGTALSPSGVTTERVRPGATETVLHSFGASGDGSYPYAPLIDVKGTLYGTTRDGGAKGGGTVFAIGLAGETVLHSFAGGSADGRNPAAGLINIKGTLYGVTENGGGSGCSYGEGCGTFFSITPSGTETVLYTFKGGSGDGGNPAGTLIDVKGTLYGTTIYGGSGSCSYYGSSGCGTVFAITPLGMENLVHSFKGGSKDGEFPYSALVDVKGTLYGTTWRGGGVGCQLGYGCGSVFSVTPSGKEQLLHGFGSAGDGTYPYSGLVKVKGMLYGTTFYGGTTSCSDFGCGTVYSISTSGTESVIHSFCGSGDGVDPEASLINVKGTLYGTTEDGFYGSSPGGTIFSITTSGTETVLYRFDASGDGGEPAAALLNIKGTLYGTTVQGGANAEGTVFSFSQ